MSALYRPIFRKQLNSGLATAKDDCGPAAARHAIDRMTLGGSVPTIPAIRKAMGVTTGQTTIYDQADAFRAFGLPVFGVFDRFDNFEIAALTDWVKRGNYFTCLGDYEKVPNNLSGDPNWNQNHLVMVNEATPIIGGKTYDGVLVYDSLDDGRRTGIPRGPIVWPWAVLGSYLHNLSDKIDFDVTVALLKRRLLNRRRDGVVIRTAPTATAAPIGTWIKGSIEYGMIVRDSSVAEPPYPQWYRVWFVGNIGFVAASDVTLAV